MTLTIKTCRLVYCYIIMGPRSMDDAHNMDVSPGGMGDAYNKTCRLVYRYMII